MKTVPKKFVDTNMNRNTRQFVDNYAFAFLNRSVVKIRIEKRKL